MQSCIEWRNAVCDDYECEQLLNKNVIIDEDGQEIAIIIKEFKK